MEGAGKVPFWRKLLHWPVVGGREIIWTCLGANAIPVMKLVGISESIASTAFSLSAVIAIFIYLIFGFLSDRCSSKLGRRRPFIIICLVFVSLGTFIQYLGLNFSKSEVLLQVLIYAGFSIQDVFLWSLQVPMTSFTLEVFYGSDQRQVMVGNAFFTGFGGIIGYLLSSYIGVVANGNVDMTLIYIATAIFAVTVISNISSMTEKTLSILKAEGNYERQSWTALYQGILKTPASIFKISLCQFFVMGGTICHYVYFTHNYAELVFSANFDELEKNMPNATADEINRNFTEKYDAGIREGSQIMILFPISTMCFSLLFDFFDVFSKIGWRVLFDSGFIFYMITAIFVTFVNSWYSYATLSVSLGFFLALICTVPYLLIERYRSRPDYPSDRGLALDCSVLSIFNSLGQVLSGLLVAKLISVFGNSFVINPYSAILTLFGLLIAHFGVEYDENEKSAIESPADKRTESIVKISS